MADQLDEVTGAVKQAITLATASLTLSLTFRKDVLGGKNDFGGVLKTAWILLGLSAVVGLWVLHKAAAMRQASNIDIDDKAIRIPWIISTCAFLAGVATFVLFGFLAF